MKPSAEEAGTRADEIIAAQLSAAANMKDEQYSGDCNLAAEQRQAVNIPIPRKPRNNVAALVEKGEIAEDKVKVSFSQGASFYINSAISNTHFLQMLLDKVDPAALTALLAALNARATQPPPPAESLGTEDKVPTVINATNSGTLGPQTQAADPGTLVLGTTKSQGEDAETQPKNKVVDLGTQADGTMKENDAAPAPPSPRDDRDYGCEPRNPAPRDDRDSP